jgi:CRP/FNR family transcriptional regulator, anaerobic regulatory protein
MPGSNVIALPTSRCSQCPVRSNAICCGLDDKESQELSGLMRHRYYKAGSSLFHQEDTSELFAILISGTIKLTREGADGRRQIIAFLSEGDCLGDLFHEVSHQGAECISDVVLCCFARKEFEAFLKAHPQLEHRLLLRVMHQLDETREWLFTLGQLKAPERLASFLLWLRRKKELALGTVLLQPDENMVGCPYSRQDIADFLGLTVETVSRNFTKFRQDNLINLHADKRIEILDTDALKRLAGTTLPGAEV